MSSVNKLADNLPTVQTVVDSSQLVEIPCFTSLPRKDLTPLDFRIDRTDWAVDPTQVYLYLKCKVVDAEGADMPSCANNLAYSMWQNVEMYINDQKITQDQNMYPWMSYLICLTRYSTQYRETALSTSLWKQDLYGMMDTAEGDNTGYIKRKDYIANEFTLYSKVMTDFIQLPKFLPPQTEVTFRFIPAPSALVFIGKGNPKIEVRDARLYVGRTKLTVNMPKEINFPVSRFSCRARMIAAGDQNVDWIPFSGKRPRRVFVAQIAQQTYNGNIARNPFRLQTFDLKQIQVYFNDLSLPSNVPTPCDNLARSYLDTIKAIDNPQAWNIELEAYKYGYFIYAVDLTNDHSASKDYRSIEKQGSLRIKIDYSKPLTGAVAVLCFAEFDDVLNIDSNGHCKWS